MSMINREMIPSSAPSEESLYEEKTQSLEWKEIALIGRPNVGKSTLFNVLTETHSALIAPQPGVTRDRKTAPLSQKWSTVPCHIHDLGGLTEAMLQKKNTRGKASVLTTQMVAQAEKAILASDLIFFLVDAKAELTVEDSLIGQWLRKLKKIDHVILVVNKAEHDRRQPQALASFYRLGISQIIPISASHRENIRHLMDIALQWFNTFSGQVSSKDSLNCFKSPQCGSDSDRIAIVGRPNAGKSSLINAILKQDRMLVSDIAGTTRESIENLYDLFGDLVVLSDTAGIRKKSALTDKLEYLGVSKAFEQIQKARLVLLVMDIAFAGQKQDLLLADKVLEEGRSLILVINKMDTQNRLAQKECLRMLEQRFNFAPYLPKFLISAKQGKNLSVLCHNIKKLLEESKKLFSTAQLCKFLQEIQQENPPPFCKKTGKRVKLKFIRQNRRAYNVLEFSIWGNQLHSLSQSYQKYLKNRRREKLSIKESPIRLVFQKTDNPFLS